ncbi:MAG: NADH-quinone oxidoreductase subunit NuoE [Bordetella sp.]|nr:MAG: NADH-quinone oxidoreductase subunit NuoE [Bordetella sp.]
MLLSKQAYIKIDKEIAKFPVEQKKSATIASLAIAQEEKIWLSADILEEIANYLDIPAISVQEVATFYRMFNLKPIGKYKISLCTNLPCALREAKKTGEYLKAKLNINYQDTTSDGLFTLIESECVGACADAPVIIINNNRMFTKMGKVEIDSLISKLSSNNEKFE